MTELTPRLSERIHLDFPAGTAGEVAAYLASLADEDFGGQDPERVQAAIVLASAGQWDRFLIRLLEIGEAVKALPDDLLATQPSIPWRQIARMRDHLAHRYFDTAHAILQATVDEDLPQLERAVQALSQSLPDEDPSGNAAGI